MPHFKTDISQTMNIIIAAATTSFRYLALSAFFSPIIQSPYNRSNIAIADLAGQGKRTFQNDYLLVIIDAIDMRFFPFDSAHLWRDQNSSGRFHTGATYFMYKLFLCHCCRVYCAERYDFKA